jgi:hypothetical protein
VLDKVMVIMLGNLFKYVKTVDFGNLNNNDETFFSICEHPLTEFIFKVHQDNTTYIEKDLKFTKIYPHKGWYDITCISKKECNHKQGHISTYKRYIGYNDIPIIKYLRLLFL